MNNNKNSTGLSWIIGAGIVGADIGTSVFYSTGLLFNYVGYLSPFFIFLVCLMMWAFKKTYEEGLALSPHNGGAYTMILRGIGRRSGVLAGGLTILSYLATATVSSLSGAFYISSLMDEQISLDKIVLISSVPIILFGLLNSKGIKEPAKLITVISGLHFGFLIILIIWGLGFIFFNWQDVDFAKMSKITVSSELTLAMIMHGFAGAFLGITGFESAAQIIEELKSPILTTLRKLYTTVILLVSFTAPFISFLCLAILSEDEIINGQDFLLASFGEKIGGQGLMVAVVIDAALTLFAAVNTAFVGFIGLAKTMAQQGNLPQILLKRFSYLFSWIDGYPFIALPFMFMALCMVSVVPGEVKVLARVYEMAFLSVMVSFVIGVILVRNRKQPKYLPLEFLTHPVFNFQGVIIPIIPLFSGIVLLIAQMILMFFASTNAQTMGTQLLLGILLVMAFYRWGVLEQRLEKRSDLHIGLGDYSKKTKLPEGLTKYVLCTGGTGMRSLITRTINYLLKEKRGDPFELIVFHVDEHNEGFFYESLQRVILQQIVPLYASRSMVLTVKTLPGDLLEGLGILRRQMDIKTILLGKSKRSQVSSNLAKELQNEFQIRIIQV